MVVNTIEFRVYCNHKWYSDILIVLYGITSLVAVYYENTIIIMYDLHSLYNNISRNWFSSHTAVDCVIDWLIVVSFPRLLSCYCYYQYQLINSCRCWHWWWLLCCCCTSCSSSSSSSSTIIPVVVIVLVVVVVNVAFGTLLGPPCSSSSIERSFRDKKSYSAELWLDFIASER